MKIGYSDIMNDIYFAVEVADNTDIGKAKQLISEGYDRWMNTEDYPEYECLGYAEPSEMLLKENGIEVINIFEPNVNDEEIDWI